MNNPTKAKQSYENTLAKYPSSSKTLANYALFAEQVERNVQKTAELYQRLSTLASMTFFLLLLVVNFLSCSMVSELKY